MKVKVAFSKLWLVIIIVTLIASTTSATTIYASNEKSSSDSSSSSAGTASSSQGSSSSNPNGGSGSINGGNPGTPSPGSSSSPPPPSAPPPNPPPNPPLTKCPDGSIPDSNGKCPSPTPTPCPNGAQPDKNGKCPPTPQPPCPKGTELDKSGKCVPIPCPNGAVLVDGKCREDCHKVDNSTIIECRGPSHTTTIVHNTIQQVPVLTGSNDINLMIVTTCTADQNNGVLNGNLAALCDPTITMMHNEGLDAQLPQVDLYLKARGLLQ